MIIYNTYYGTDFNLKKSVMQILNCALSINHIHVKITSVKLTKLKNI